MMLMVVAPSLAMAQISVYVQSPPDIAGPLNFTWPEGDWAADLNDPAFTVEDTLVVVNDGSVGDSLGCGPAVNAAELAGNIALVYRGTSPGEPACEFGAKALNAQNAGAVGVIIVNNISGPPVGMGAGAVGTSVTIPVVMISDMDGAMLREWMLQSDVVVRIGTLTGIFPYNLGTFASGVLLPRAASTASELALDDTDYNFSLGSMVVNYGSADQSNVQLQAVITQDGTEVYNETSDPADVIVGDSVFFTLPDFTQSSYSGHYELTYTILSDSTDAFELNDTYTTSFHVGDVFTYAEVDPATGTPVADTWIAPATNPSGFRSCIYFQHPNASRVAATGLHVSLWANADSVFAGNFISVQANMWNGVITDYVSLPLDDNSDLFEEQYGDHILSDDERGETIYVPFLEPLVLVDDQPYLFCLISNDPRTYHGFDADLEYDQNMIQYNLPISNIYSSQWFNGFTGFNTHPSIGVNLIDVNTIGIKENDRLDITPFPNPTVDNIRIPLIGQTGSATLEIFDIAGNKIAERRVSVNAQEQIVVDMNGISNGTYMFNMAFENGKRASFRVVVSR
jgi:hypothetical protein